MYLKRLVDVMIDSEVSVSIISVNPKSDGYQLKNYRGQRLIEIDNKDLLKRAIVSLKPDIIHAHSLKREVCNLGKELGIPVVVTAHHGGIVCPGGALMNHKDEICSVKINHRNCLPCVLRNVPGWKYLWYPMMRRLSEDTYLKLGEKLESKPFVLFVTPVGSSARYVKEKEEEWREITAGCTIMIAPSYKLAEAMVRNGLDKNKIKVLPHGVPLPSQKSSNNYEKGATLKFYYTGRICYIKGLHVLIKAFRRLRHQNVELHIIGGAGNKGENKYMKRLIRNSHKDKRIIWHGKVSPEEILNYTKDYHIAVAPSICLEAYGLNIAEALAQGKPVLTTRCGGGEMQITDGVNGWLVEPNNVEALLAKIEMVSTHPEIIAKMSKHCEAISMSRHADELMKVYEEILKK